MPRARPEPHADNLDQSLDQSLDLNLDLDGEILPARCADWTLIVLGGLRLPDAAAARLHALGFGLDRQPPAAGLDTLALEPQPRIYLAPAAWLAAQPQPLPPCRTTGAARAILVGVAGDAGAEPRLGAIRAGALALIEDAADVTALLTALAGLAWIPARPYQVLLAVPDPQRQVQTAARLRQAGFAVLDGTDPLAASASLTADPLDLLVLGPAAPALGPLAPDLPVIDLSLLPDDNAGALIAQALRDASRHRRMQWRWRRDRHRSRRSAQRSENDASELAALALPARSPADYRILVAEDDPTTQAILRAQFGALGVTASIVETGAAALAVWQDGHWDLICTDYNMPDMNGGDLTRAIRMAEQDRGGHVPIIAITGGLPETLEACRAAGMDDILSKPLRMEGLRRMLNRWLPGADTPAPEPAPAAPVSVLDPERLRAAIGTVDPELRRDLLALFIRTARSELADCNQALAGPDFAVLGQSAHKMKSAAQTIGANRLAALLVQLEQHAATRDAARTTAGLRELEDALAEVARLAAEPDPASLDTAPAPSALALDGSSLPNSVLIVDDDAVIRRQLTLAFRSLGISEIVAVDDGRNALAALDTMPRCELVITDLSMPGMDGVEFMRHLNARGYRGRLVLISGLDERLLHSALDLARMQCLNVHGILRKPVTRDELLVLLQRSGSGVASAGNAGAAPSLHAEEILEGMRRDEFAIHFQPKVDARTLRIVGVEALARWNRQAGGFVPPDLFITVAEREGVIGQLSAHLFARVLRDIKIVFERGYYLAVAVNLSASELNALELPESLRTQVETHGLRTADIILEITETGVMADPRHALEVMMRFRLLGFQLAIDDFGIGYSTMQQLLQFPFSELKLDRGFVHGAARDPATRAILASSVQMARKLGLGTVAEGVETQEDLDLVRALGCNLVQGWFVARAMPVTALLDWLGRGQ